MKQVSDYVVCGPFIFMNDVDTLKRIYLEMCDEYPIFKKMCGYENKKVVVYVAVISENGVYGEYIGQSIFLSHNILKRKKLIKRSLIHEYIHFIQHLNTKKNFSGLNFERFVIDDFKSFLFHIFSELDAYLKSNLICNNKFTESMEIVDFAKYFEMYSCKFSHFCYAEEFDFLNMKNYISNKKEFIKTAECILNTFTGPEYGGEVFSKYNINWDEMFKLFKEIYILNRNFDIMAQTKKYDIEKMNNFLYKKFKFEDIKKFLLNYKVPNTVNNSLLAVNKKER